MNKLFKILMLFVFSISQNVNAQKNGLEKLDFFIGEWAIETSDIQPNGSYAKGRAKSVVKYILDDQAIQDDFLMLGKDGAIVFRGTSIRSYNQRTNKFQIVWIMPGHNGITDISAQWIDGKLISNGKGYDDNGEFLERFEYFDITKNAYSFKMDRSYDNGKNWIKDFALMKATRIE